MRGQQGSDGYDPPVVADYGDLVAITSAHMPIAQGEVSDLAFSAPGGEGGNSPGGPGHGSVDGGAQPDAGAVGGVETVGRNSPSGDFGSEGGGSTGDFDGGGTGSGGGGGGSGGDGGGDSGGGDASGSGGGGGDGKLPFTGFAAAAAAAIGTGMTVAGGFMRKALRGRRS